MLDIATQKESRIRGLPRALRLADLAWSPDQRYLAFSHVAYKGERGSVELWLVDIAARKASRLSAQPLSAVLTRGFNWLPDSSGLLVHWRPAGIGKAPVSDGIPSGPIQQDTDAGGGLRQLRTYQDLLKNEADARLFEYYVTVQMVLLDLHGKGRPIGEPGQFSRTSIAPGRPVSADAERNAALLVHRARLQFRRAGGSARSAWHGAAHGGLAAAGGGPAAGE